MAIISTTGYCKACDTRAGFRCEYIPDTLVLDETTPMRCANDECRAPYAEAYVAGQAQPVMCKRHVRDFWAEGHVIQQLNPKDYPGRERMAFSQSEYDRKVAAAGLDPDSGGVKYATNSGYAPTNEDPSQL